MKLQRILDNLRQVAPESLAEPWDKAGLAVGDPDRNIRHALLCIDLTPPVLQEAIDRKAGLVVAYHPPIFKPLDRITTADWKGALLLRAIEKRIAIYSPHTALDAAVDGVNDFLASAFTGRRTPITPTASPDDQLKLVTFVPPDTVDTIRRALSDAGAGRIGHYEQCSFAAPGRGTFKGDDTTNPAVGTAGQLEHVDELRLEMLLPGHAAPAVIDALRRHHPYEEPAFDLIRLAAAPTLDDDATTGQGRIVALNRPTTLKAAVARLKKHLGVKHLDVAGRLDHSVRRLALCAGAGGSLLAAAGEIDLFITGEMRHHDVLAASARGTAIILAGHTQTERPYLPVYRDRIASTPAGDIDWHISEHDQPPGRIL